MSSKESTRVSLVDQILGSDKTVKNLSAKKYEIDVRLANMQSHFDELSSSLFRNRSILAFANGRIGQTEFGFAEKILDAAEKDLIALNRSIKSLKSLKEMIDEIAQRVDESRQVEENMMKVERYLIKRESASEQYSRISPDGKTVASSDFHQELLELRSKSKMVSHSVDAFLDLKAGK